MPTRADSAGPAGASGRPASATARRGGASSPASRSVEAPPDVQHPVVTGTARRWGRATHPPAGTRRRHPSRHRRARTALGRTARRSAVTSPVVPATATDGSSRARRSGVTMSPVGLAPTLEEHDDPSGRASEADVPGGRGAETDARPDDLRAGRLEPLDDRRHLVRRVIGDDRRPSSRRARTIAEPPRTRSRSAARSVASDDDRRRRRSARSSSRDGTLRLDAVADAWPFHDVRRRRGRQGEVGAAIDDLPAGRLDLRRSRSASAQSCAARAANGHGPSRGRRRGCGCGSSERG